MWGNREGYGHGEMTLWSNREGYGHGEMTLWSNREGYEHGEMTLWSNREGYGQGKQRTEKVGGQRRLFVGCLLNVLVYLTDGFAHTILRAVTLR